VFWNKEDPPNFNLFLPLAKLFDYVFTTDVDCIPRYQKAMPHKQIAVLPFAAQPCLHNPVDRMLKRLGQVAFAGTWYNSKYPRRSRDLEMMLTAAMAYQLSIYDRMYSSSRKDLYGFPDCFQAYVKGYLPYSELVQAYRQYDVFLNVDSVSSSPTMFSRRVYELLACGTAVVSAYSKGIEHTFPGIIPLCRSQEEVAQALQILLSHKQYKDQLSLLGQRAVFNQHSYRHRLSAILKVLGRGPANEPEPVSILTHAKSPHLVQATWENFLRQRDVSKELIVVLNLYNRSLKHEWDKISAGRQDLRVFAVDGLASPNRLLNIAFLQSTAPYISLFNENDYYGANFIGDLMNAMNYTQAAIVGKQSYYTNHMKSTRMKLENAGTEYQYCNSVQPSACLIHKERSGLMDKNDDLALLLRTMESNPKKIYASDRFNYLCKHQLSKSLLRPQAGEQWQKQVII
jgi:hypothetical protein